MSDVRDGGSPFPSDLFTAQFEPVTCDGPAETIPIFRFPLGFHTISLWYLAQYYDGTARPFYDHFLLYPEQNPLSTSPHVDYGRILVRICQFVLRSDSASGDEISRFLTAFYDRKANIAALLRARSPGGDSYVINRVPRMALSPFYGRPANSIVAMFLD